MADDTHREDELYREALAAGRARNYARAVEILTRLVGSSDRFPEALLYLGRSYHALGEHARAAQALSFYLRGRPDSVAGRFFLGRAYLALGQYPQAARQLRGALEAQPRFAAAHGLLGIVYLRERRPDKAIWSFARSLEIDPQNKRLQVGYLNAALVLAIRLFYRGNLVDSARLFSEVLEQRPGSILPHLYLASIYRDLGRENMALFHTDAAVRLSPEDPFLHLQKGLILLAQGQRGPAAAELQVGSTLLKTAVSPGTSADQVLRFMILNLLRERRFREAIFYATRLLRAAYNDPALHVVVAEAYRQLGDLAKSKNHYRRAIEQDGKALEPRYGLLAVLWERGEFRELMTEASRVLQRDTADSTARYFQSLALSRTGAPIETVLRELQGQVRARGPDPVLMAELGSVYLRGGMPDLAEGWLRRVLKLSKGDARTLLRLSEAYEAMGQPKRQARTMKEYLALRPTDGKARSRLARLLLTLESFSEAAEELARLLPLQPRSSKLKSALALCYRRTGKYAEALVLLKDLLTGSPADEDYLKAAVYCLDRMGARGVAVKVLDGFLKQHGERLSLRLMLGVLWYQDGDFERAASAFRAAVSQWPTDWRANRNLGMVYRRMGNGEFAEKYLAKAAKLQAAMKP